MKRLIYVIVFTTLAFCIAIALNLSPLLRGPAPYPPQWQWAYQFTNTFSKIWLPVLVASVIGWLFFQAWNDKGIEKRENIILAQFVFLYFLFLLSVVYFQRSGINVLLHRIIDPGLNGYFTTGIGIKNLGEFVKTYNQNVLHFYQHAQGHPPLAVLLFYFLKQILNFGGSIPIQPNGDVGVIWAGLKKSEQLTAIFSSFFIPFTSTLALIPLYKLTKLLYGVRAGLISILLYISVPSIILFTPLNDVFLPIFTLTALYLLILGTDQQSKLKLFIAGLIFSVGLMFSISLIPLLLIILSIFFIRKKKKMATELEFSLFAGIIIFPALFSLLGNNFLELIKVLKSGLPENRPYGTWVFYNLYDFFIFCGIPASFLFFANIKAEVVLSLKKYFSRLDIFPISFIAMLLILNFSGSTRGEVSRIWLPFAPLVIIPASNYLKFNKNSTKLILVLFALQILQLLIMQEFWITLY